MWRLSLIHPKDGCGRSRGRGHCASCRSRELWRACTRARIWAAKSGGGRISNTASKARAFSAACRCVSSLDDMALTPFIGVEKPGQGAWEAPFDGFPTHLQNTCDLVILTFLQVA